MDVKDPTVSFTKSRRAVAGTLEQFQILALIDCWESNGKPLSIICAKKLLRQQQRSLKSMVQLVISSPLIPGIVRPGLWICRLERFSAERIETSMKNRTQLMIRAVGKSVKCLYVKGIT